MEKKFVVYEVIKEIECIVVVIGWSVKLVGVIIRYCVLRKVWR